MVNTVVNTVKVNTNTRVLRIGSARHSILKYETGSQKRRTFSTLDVRVSLPPPCGEKKRLFQTRVTVAGFICVATLVGTQAYLFMKANQKARVTLEDQSHTSI